MGLELALGATTIWQVEKDSYARQVLAARWPKASRDVHDIREAGAHNLRPVDVLCGGFPCQGLSVAGKGRGLSDERSSLWFEMLRVIRELRPSVVVLENVPAIRTRGLGVVLGGLASLGYDAEWGVFGAADVGAPHRRQRWWCVAYLPNAIGGVLWEQSGRSGGARREGQAQPCFDGKEQPMAHPEGQRPSIGQRQRRDAQQELPTTLRTGGATSKGDVKSLVGRTPHGLPAWTYSGREVEPWEMVPRTIGSDVDPNRVQRLRCLGNAVVPQWSYWVGMKVREILS